MTNCKKKLRSPLSIPRSAGVCLLVALLMPTVAGCVHLFYGAGIKKFTFPAKVLSATAPAAQTMPSAQAMTQEEWLDQEATPERLVAENLEQEIARLTNELREENNLEPLQHRSALDEVARSHSQEMANLNYFAHQSPTRANRTAEDRLQNAGMDYMVLAENIAKEPLVRAFWSDGRVEYYTWREVAQNSVRHWFSSIGHRRNMLRRDVEEIGIGAAIDSTQSRSPYVYLTQTFRSP